MRLLGVVAAVVPLALVAGCGDPVTVDVAGQTMQQLASGTRAQRLEALANIPAFEFVPREVEAVILECLADADPAVRTDAAEALQFIDPQTQGHLKPVIQKAFETESDPRVKQELKSALDILGVVVKVTDPKAALPEKTSSP